VTDVQSSINRKVRRKSYVSIEPDPFGPKSEEKSYVSIEPDPFGSLVAFGRGGMKK
jgi:hypothetical protein